MKVSASILLSSPSHFSELERTRDRGKENASQTRKEGSELGLFILSCFYPLWWDVYDWSYYLNMSDKRITIRLHPQCTFTLALSVARVIN
jgi:hypothetical protein